MVGWIESYSIIQIFSNLMNKQKIDRQFKNIQHIFSERKGNKVTVP